MNVFSQFGRTAPNKVFLSIILGAIAGFAYAALIPTLLLAINEPVVGGSAYSAQAPYLVFGIEIAHHQAAILFGVLCLVIWTCRTLSQTILMYVAISVSNQMRKSLHQAVARSPIERLERVGLVRIKMALGADVARIVGGARTVPDLLINCITVAGMLSFLLYLNSSVFFLTLLVILVGAVTYRIPVFVASKYFERSRKVQERQGEAIRALVEGAKELKINTNRRKHFFADELIRNEDAICSLDARGATIMRAATSYGDLISIGAIGVVAFIFVNYWTIAQSELMGIVTALIYLKGPIAAIMSAIPQLTLARISERKLADLMSELPAEVTDEHPVLVPPWQVVTFANVCFEHSSRPGTREFRVGPLDFEIRRGQITMIVGGNGSGKTTIGKLVSMHYLPADGSIFFDDRKVDARLISSYREEISAIYSDYYLFERLFGLANYDQVRIDAYLSLLKLSDKVAIEDGRFSTLNLSDGQRKRLALLAAYLEDRTLYLFDEWAADQDPEFKLFFYERLLPDLRKDNKAVVVITHDDRYFDVADQLLFVEDGKIGRREIRQTVMGCVVNS